MQVSQTIPKTEAAPFLQADTGQSCSPAIWRGNELHEQLAFRQVALHRPKWERAD
jgi:hypothetical protein